MRSWLTQPDWLDDDSARLRAEHERTHGLPSWQAWVAVMAVTALTVALVACVFVWAVVTP